MRILLIKPKHIGDSLILTPTIVAIKTACPEAEIWVVVRRGCEGILVGCPEIDRILTVAAVDRRERRSGDFWRGLGVMLRLAATRFDYVFELGDGHRGRLLARLTWAKRRYSVRPATPLKARETKRFTAISGLDWEPLHRVEKDFRTVAEFLPLPEPIPPLRFAPERTREWPPARDLQDFCVMQIGTRQDFNSWHADGWAEVGAWLLGQFQNVVITSGSVPDEIKLAEKLQAQFGPRVLCTRGEAYWAQVAGLLYRAKLYVGLNTATMHLAAACGCPAVALFGTTSEVHWAPWQSPHRTVSAGDDSPDTDAQVVLTRMKDRTMAGISAAKVIAACEALMRRDE